MSYLARWIPDAEWLALFAELAGKSTLVLLLTAAAAALLWRSSAAARHMVWCVGVVGVLLLPLFSALVPAWELPLLPTPRVPAPRVEVVVEESGAATMPGEVAVAAVPLAGPLEGSAAAAGASPLDLVVALVVAGTLVGLLWLSLGFWGVARLGRHAVVARDTEWLRLAQDAAERLRVRRPVLLLRSREAVMPATWGLFWPSVILPITADMWPEDRRRAVLAHELAHVKRFDCLTQALARLACVLYWWHPLVWYAARRLRVERERACDDLVLATGARASDYATHLLEIARSHRSLRITGPALLAMAKPSQLESRLLEILDGARPRGAPSLRSGVLSVAAGLLVVSSLAAVRPTRAVAAGDGASATAVAAARTPAPLPAPESVLPPPPSPALPGDPRPDLPAQARPASPPDTIPRWSTIEELIALRSVGVDSAYIAELRRAGYHDLTSRELIEMRAVGVSGRYAGEMNAAGLGRLTPEQLVELSAVGVTPEYVAELRRAGYTELSVDEIQTMRAVGVRAEYIEAMRAAGFGRLTPEQLTELRAVGATPEYLREMSQYGISGMSLNQIVSMRAVGVTGEYISQMSAAGLDPLDAEALVEMRAVGVTPEYIRELAGVGLAGLSAERLVELKAHGITADYIRELAEVGLGPLSADQLIRLRASGVDRELIPSRRTRPSREP